MRRNRSHILYSWLSRICFTDWLHRPLLHCNVYCFFLYVVFMCMRVFLWLPQWRNKWIIISTVTYLHRFGNRSVLFKCAKPADDKINRTRGKHTVCQGSWRDATRSSASVASILPWRLYRVLRFLIVVVNVELQSHDSCEVRPPTTSGCRFM